MKVFSMNRESNFIIGPSVYLLVVACLFLVPSASACGQVNLAPVAGWRAFAIVTEGDNISNIADAGYGTVASRGKYDGLGAIRAGNDVSVWINHETSSAAISRVVLDRAKLRQAIRSTIDNGQTVFPTSLKTAMGYAYVSIFDGSYHAVNNPLPVASGTINVGLYGDANFDRFCSGTSYPENSFGDNLGFVDNLYLTGEEVSSGKLYALQQDTRTLWEIPDAGSSPWENTALIDTGNTTHVALLLFADEGNSPGEPLRLYVGEKGVDDNADGEIDLLERNGLRGGVIYYFDPDPGFSLTDLPDGQVTGTWTSNINNALRETKLEDIHTNPLDGSEVVFADQTDGLYRMDLGLVFTPGGIDLANSVTTIIQIDDDDTGQIGAPDNLTWSADGFIYVEEDGDGDSIFQLNDDGTGILEIAMAFSEPSGIIDISELAGYLPGSVFLTSVMGDDTSDAQLIALISPVATGPNTVVAEGVKLLDGVPAGGQFSHLNINDDQTLELDPSPTANPLKQRVDFLLLATSTSNAPAEFGIRLESRMLGGVSGDVIQTIELLDYQTGMFELVDARPAAITDELLEIVPAGDAGRFVQAISGEITVRITWRSESFSGTPFFWSVDIDEAVWTVLDPN